MILRNLRTDGHRYSDVMDLSNHPLLFLILFGMKWWGFRIERFKGVLPENPGKTEMLESF